MHRFKRALLFVASSTVLLACGPGCGTDDGEPIPDINTSCEVEPNFPSIHGQILSQDSCSFSGCHAPGSSGGPPAAGLDFSQTASITYATLVGQPSLSGGGLNLVEAGDADASFLYIKVAEINPPGASGQMPPGRAKLGPCEVNAISEWIDTGAALQE